MIVPEPGLSSMDPAPKVVLPSSRRQVNVPLSLPLIQDGGYQDPVPHQELRVQD